jgi:general secretion pathway protein D
MRYNLLTNQLVVHQTPSNHERIRTLLDDLDKRPTEVAIEAKFLNLSVNDDKSFGFNWEGTFSDPSNPPDATVVPDRNFDIDGDGDVDTIPGNLNNDGSVRSPFDFIATALTGSGAFSPGPGSVGLGVSIIDNANGDNLSVTFDAMDSVGEVELLSAPRVTTMNQKPAVIADFTEEYFQIGATIDEFIVTQGTQTTATEPVLSRSVRPIIQSFLFGFSLSVTPYISGDQIRLWLNPQVINRAGTKQFQAIFGSADNSQNVAIELPTVNTQSVWTNVIVSDGDTLVLGGLVRDDTTKSVSKFPYLGDIPLIGFFFRGKSRSVNQSSLMIFVTPTIIDPSGARSFEPAL